MKKPQRSEGVEEVWARRVASRVLNRPVERFDVGGQSQVDAVIELDDERVGALEVIGDYDKPSMAMYAALGGIEKSLQLVGLEHSWLVHVTPAARIKKIAPELGSVLKTLEQQGISHLHVPRHPHDHLSDSLAGLLALNVTYVLRVDGMAGTVTLRAAAWGGSIGPDDVDLGTWVTKVLDEQDDVAPKLASHPEAAERHAFIWVSSRSDGALRYLMRDWAAAETSTDPVVPVDITHVWVASMGGLGGVFLWTSGQGWSRTSWEWPATLEEFKAAEEADGELRAARAAEN